MYVVVSYKVGQLLLSTAAKGIAIKCSSSLQNTHRDPEAEPS